MIQSKWNGINWYKLMKKKREFWWPYLPNLILRETVVLKTVKKWDWSFSSIFHFSASFLRPRKSVLKLRCCSNFLSSSKKTKAKNLYQNQSTSTNRWTTVAYLHLIKLFIKKMRIHKVIESTYIIHKVN
jgi:hypothetical protein